jgi:hypothetical protein
VQPVLRVVDVAVEETPVIGEEHDLPDGRTGGFRHHPIDEAAARRHPGSGKIHLTLGATDHSPEASDLRFRQQGLLR